MFRPVESNVQFPALEAEILRFWKEHGIYQKSLDQRQGAPRFVFYEGPPTANGMPHPGHCLTRAIKDLFPRYQTMRGRLCERKAGWDTHGLPVEVEVCKALGIHSKEEIEAYGVEPFIHRCQESVWRYMQEWERLTERLGFWVNLEEAYVTYHQSYVESVWWALKNLFDRGLLYQGYKIVWWWAQGGTALSAGEVGQGYREVADPSVYVRFPLLDDAGQETDESLLVWTTTPWTLPSNQFAAVHPDLEYSVAVDAESGQKIVIASALVETIAGKIGRPLMVERTLSGKALVGRRYVPPFDYYYAALKDAKGELKSSSNRLSGSEALDLPSMEFLYWRVVAAHFVTIDSGSGVVHQSPAFGEVDFQLLINEQSRFKPVGISADAQGFSAFAVPRPELFCPVGPDGKFTADAADYQGRWVKDCDKDISRELRRRGLLFHQEQYLHEYPFCWRAEEDPLIQYPRRSWFIRTTEFKDEMLANNEQINWLPEHIKHGRFGNFLDSNVDWALSRERYWGTPLPIWRCSACGSETAVANFDELMEKEGIAGTETWTAAKRGAPELSDHLKIHKPYIDAVTFDCSAPNCKNGRMHRVPDVIDCWFDSGAMPFAQWGYPHERQSSKKFGEQFPADFISEALDQTRGWFYSQLAISTLLFGKHPDAVKEVEYPHPFKNCIVLGLMLGEDGTKMSKSKRNYREPNEIFDRYGADALRWYFFANQPPWTSIRYNERSIKDSIPEFLLRLWNVYSFFVIYATIDGFDSAAALPGDAGMLDSPALARAKTQRPAAERSELDRWILSELNRTAAAVVERMDAYDNFGACGQITAFVDALSNWYVRRSRDRFWSEDKHDRDKLDAYWTLYECLLTACKIVAPFVPFMAEGMWRNLAAAEFGRRAPESVHLCDYPVGDPAAIDEQLSARMNLVREISSLGRSARMGAKLKVRQPLAKVEVILADATHQHWLAEHAALICDELNVKQVEFAARADQYISYTVLPDLKKLGPKIGKRLPVLKKALAEADGGKLMAELQDRGRIVLPLADGALELGPDELQIRLEAKPGWAAAQGKGCVVVLATQLDELLLAEGLAREIVHAVQTRRKDLDCNYTDRIAVGVASPAAEVGTAIDRFADYIRGETLAVSLVPNALGGVEAVEVKLGEHAVQLHVQVVPSA